jgi:hypothetical protein
MLLLFVAHPSVRSAICQGGLQVYWDGGYKGVVNEAFITSWDYSGSHALSLRGSFVAEVSEVHEFKLWCATYKTSYTGGGRCRTSLTLDDWYVPEGPKNENQYASRLLHKDFRYWLQEDNSGHFYWVKMSLDVQYPGRGYGCD